MRSNMALNLAPFSRWTLRDKAAQRRLALRWVPLESVVESQLCDLEGIFCHAVNHAVFIRDAA